MIVDRVLIADHVRSVKRLFYKKISVVDCRIIVY